MGLLDHMVVLFLTFRGSSTLFFIVAAPFYILTNTVQGFQFLHILALTFFFFDNSHSNRCAVISHCGFFFNKFIYFIYLFLAVLGLPCGVRASHSSGFSCGRARALGAWASVVVARGLSSCGSLALERRLRNCGTWG